MSAGICLLCDLPANNVAISCRCLSNHVVCADCAQQRQDESPAYWRDLFGSDHYIMCHIVLRGVLEYNKKLEQEEQDLLNNYFPEKGDNVWFQWRKILNDPRVKRQADITSTVSTTKPISIAQLGYHELLTEVIIERQFEPMIHRNSRGKLAEKSNMIDIKLKLGSGDIIAFYTGQHRVIQFDIMYPMLNLPYSNLILDVSPDEEIKVTLCGYQLSGQLLNILQHASYFFDIDNKVYQVVNGCLISQPWMTPC